MVDIIVELAMSGASVTSVDSTLKSRSELIVHDPVSDELALVFQWIFYAVVSELIAVFGTVANIINIICFSKQGFKEVSNISLLGLAVSDLCSLVTLIWANICCNPAFNELDLPFEPMEIQYMTGSGLHVILTRVTVCITAQITFERCLCVTMPLKVKRIFTRKVVTSLVVIFFTVVVGFHLPAFHVTVLVEKYSALRNKTILGFIYTEDRDIVEAVVFVFTSCFIQMGAFTVVVVCTILLVVKLNSTTKWREISTKHGKDDMSRRDKKVTRMVVAISTLLIICFIPICFVMFAMISQPEFSIQGRYRNSFFSFSGICLVFEATNSALNIFIYYQMSSKYRVTFRQLFNCRS